MTLRVNEIFYSIQGESTYAGRPCVFVRLTGCNLRCSYCDTTYAYENGYHMDVSDIFDCVEAFHCSLVEITGGEPLIQNETPALVKKFLSEGYEVLLETNGSIDIRIIDERCARIVDVKCPSSGMSKKNHIENLKYLCKKDELKFVISNRKDYEYAKGVLNSMAPKIREMVAVNFSPVFGRLDPVKLVEWILGDHLDARLNLQLHKYIWGPNAKGV